MEIDTEHAKQWVLEHLWDYFPDGSITYTEDGVETLNQMFKDYVDKYYILHVSDPVYDKDTRTLSVSVSMGFKGE